MEVLSRCKSNMFSSRDVEGELFPSCNAEKGKKKGIVKSLSMRAL
jgi:hypothetical protein